MIPGIMGLIFCGLMVAFPMRVSPIEEKITKVEPESKPKPTEIIIVPDNPQSRRYQMGDINWKEFNK